MMGASVIEKTIAGVTAAIAGGLLGAAVVVAPAAPSPIDASFQLENFCSATSVEDFDLTDGVDNGVFFTAAHCVVSKEVGDKFTVSNLTGSYEVELMAYDKDRDIAYLKTTDKVPEGLARLPLNLKGLETGDKVTLLGYPFGFSSKAITEGIVGEDWMEGELGRTYVIASIAGGFSGGTMVNSNGEFVGIVIAALMNQFESHSSFSVSVSPEDIKGFIDDQLNG